MVDFNDLKGGLRPVLLDIESSLIVVELANVTTCLLGVIVIGDSILVDAKADFTLVSIGLEISVLILGNEKGKGRFGVTVTLTCMR